MKKTLIILSCLSLSASLSAQSDPPVGGYSQPIWRTIGEYSIEVGKVCADLNGDGVEEIYGQEISSLNSAILDGATGELWFKPEDGFHHLDKHGFMDMNLQDFNGDGAVDLLIRNQEYSTATISQAGSIAIVAGGSGSLLWQSYGTSEGYHLGSEFLLSDLDGDGLPDVVSFSDRTHVQAMSGLTGATLWQHSISDLRKIQVAGDINGDAVPEIAGRGFGIFVLWDGATGAELWTSPNCTAATWPEADVIDLTGDGTPDFLLRDSGYTHGSIDYAGGAQLLNGVDGSLVWEAYGTSRMQTFATHREFYDADGDQQIDVLLSGGQNQRALKGADGSVFWSNSILISANVGEPWTGGVDLTQDGISDWVLRRSMSGSGSVVAIDGGTGLIVWETPLTSPGQNIWGIELKDVNADGVADVIAAFPQDLNGGEIRAIDGANGTLLWSHYGGTEANNLGKKLELYSSSSGPDSIVTLVVLPDDSGLIRSLNTMDGTVLWDTKVGGSSFHHEWVWEDLNGDGQIELMNWDRLELNATVLNPDSGAVVNRVTEDRGQSGFAGTMSDLDADGWRDVVNYGLVNYFDSAVRSFSTRQSTYVTGLTLSDDHLSISSGGAIQIDVEFPIRHAGSSYRLLMSAHGTGPTAMSLTDVPLTADAMFQRMADDRYPRTFIGETGELNGKGRASIGLIALPNAIPPALAGRVIHLAVVVENPHGEMFWSSGAESLQIRS